MILYNNWGKQQTCCARVKKTSLRCPNQRLMNSIYCAKHNYECMNEYRKQHEYDGLPFMNNFRQVVNNVYNKAYILNGDRNSDNAYNTIKGDLKLSSIILESLFSLEVMEIVHIYIEGGYSTIYRITKQHNCYVDECEDPGHKHEINIRKTVNDIFYNYIGRFLALGKYDISSMWFFEYFAEYTYSFLDNDGWDIVSSKTLVGQKIPDFDSTVNIIARLKFWYDIIKEVEKNSKNAAISYKHHLNDDKYRDVIIEMGANSDKTIKVK